MKVKQRGEGAAEAVSISRAAFEAALGTVEQQFEGRVGEDQFEELFGKRIAYLKTLGLLGDVLIDAYMKEAERERQGSALVDEGAQARKLLAKYDGRPAKGNRTRRSKGKAAQSGGQASSDPKAPDAGDDQIEPDAQPLPQGASREARPVDRQVAIDEQAGGGEVTAEQVLAPDRDGWSR